MKIQTKLVLLVVVVSIGFVLVAGIFLNTLGELTRLSVGLRNGHTLIGKVWKLQSATQDMILTENLWEAYETWGAAVEELREYEARFFENQAIERWAARRGALDQYDNAVAFYEEVDTKIADFVSGYERVVGDSERAVAGFYREVFINKNMRYLFLNNEARGLIAYLGDTTEGVVVRLVDLLDGTYENLRQRITLFAVAITVAVVLAISTFILVFTRSLRNRFAGIDETMHELASGDFTKHLAVRGRDELATLSTNINSFIDQFSEIIRKIKDTSDRTVSIRDELESSTEGAGAAVAEIAESINSIAAEVDNLKASIDGSSEAVGDITGSIGLLAQQIDSQSSAVQESSSSIEEMAASIQNVARVAASKQEATDTLVAVTKTGGEKVAATNAIVEDITDSVNAMMEIIGIINKIASQTNMLSMNAAIEAAHAGDAGRGFSVVAEEIRNLSESTNLNAKKIRETLQEIRNRADEAQALSQESSAFFEQIFGEVDGVTQALKEIASTMDELSVGSNEILSSTSELTQTTTIINETSGSIRERTTRIDDSMRDIRSFTEGLRSRITSVDEAAGGIRRAMSHVAEISARNSQNISELSAEVNQFVVDDTSDALPRDADGSPRGVENAGMWEGVDGDERAATEPADTDAAAATEPAETPAREAEAQPAGHAGR